MNAYYDGTFSTTKKRCHLGLLLYVLTLCKKRKTALHAVDRKVLHSAYYRLQTIHHS